ncbi:hypothetical protein CsatB_030888 [Cannabis sativa]
MKEWDRIYHCDGLLLLVNYGRKKTITMVLCNPTLKESMILPKPKDDMLEAYCRYIGFEHDSRNNKYKFVSIWLHKKECQVEVYTLGSDSWREINVSQDVMDYMVHSQLRSTVSFGGVCYWYMNLDGMEKILSFDMSSEEFHMIDLPDFEPLIALEDSFVCYYPALAVWNDSVVMYLAPHFPWGIGSNLDKSIFFVFTMDKGVAGGWTKYEQIGPLEKYFNYLLLPFWKNDEILMEVFEDGIWGAKHMASCNIQLRPEKVEQSKLVSTPDERKHNAPLRSFKEINPIESTELLNTVPDVG